MALGVCLFKNGTAHVPSTSMVAFLNLHCASNLVSLFHPLKEGTSCYKISAFDSVSIVGMNEDFS